MAASLVDHVIVAVVPEPVAATAVTEGAVTSAVANVAGAAGGTGEVLELPAASVDVTRKE